MKTASAMEFFQPFLAAFGILLESIKLLPKNGKLIALTLIPTLLLSSLVIVSFNISSKSMFDNMMMSSASAMTAMTSFSGEITPEFSSPVSRLRRDTGLVFLINIAFAVTSSIISIISATAIILISAISKTDKTLSFKNFVLLVIKTCVRPLITAFYTYLLGLGYFFFILAIYLPIFSFSEFGRIRFTIILLMICAYISYLYFSMTLILSLVVSVVEENCYGMEALGKAAVLIKGKRFQGFILSAIFAAFTFVAFQGLWFITDHKWLANATGFWLVFWNFWCLEKLCVFVSYTVLYLQCKKQHGEEIELQGGSAEMYQKISKDDMP